MLLLVPVPVLLMWLPHVHGLARTELGKHFIRKKIVNRYFYRLPRTNPSFHSTPTPNTVICGEESFLGRNLIAWLCEELELARYRICHLDGSSAGNQARTSFVPSESFGVDSQVSWLILSDLGLAVKMAAGRENKAANEVVCHCWISMLEERFLILQAGYVTPYTHRRLSVRFVPLWVLLKFVKFIGRINFV